MALAEAVWVMKSIYDRTAHEIVAAVDGLLAHETLSVQDPDVVASALEQYRRHPALGFTDCLVLEAARRAGHVPLGTFDPGLSRLDGTVRLKTA